MTIITLDQFGDVLLPEEVGKILHIGKNNVYKGLRTGTIPSIRIGKKYLVPKVYLIEYLSAGMKSKEHN